MTAGALVASDGRGKHRNRPHSIPEEVKQKIREHIKKFPRRKSHYSRSDKKKSEYLNDGLSIARMYQLYLQKYEPQVQEVQAKPEVKEWLYRKIFNEEFNLSFGYPRSDTCETCDLLHVAILASRSDVEREGNQDELASHDEPWSKVNLLKGRKRLPPSQVLFLPEKYPNGHPVKSKKLDDLQRMIPFLPAEHRPYYQNLLISVRTTDSDDE